MNLPNKLTVARVCMVPLFMVALMLNTEVSRVVGDTVIFALASFTDMLDGKIARKYNLITNFGKLMDPLADKNFRRPLPWYVWWSWAIWLPGLW